MSVLLVYACPYLHFHATSPCSMFMLHPCCMSMLHVHDSCSCCILCCMFMLRNPYYKYLLHVPAPFPRCILLMLHDQTAFISLLQTCPYCISCCISCYIVCCMSILHVHLTCLGCMSILHVPAVCPCCMSLLQVIAACP
jgi:hypothetical protein